MTSFNGLTASERLAERNDILTVINQIDSELNALCAVKSRRSAALCREMLDTRAVLECELRGMGFYVPPREFTGVSSEVCR